MSGSGASCYYPNGNLSPDGDIPCGSGDGVACCPLNWQCIDNGLCYLDAQKYIGRYTCTDKSWKASGCPNICTQDLSAIGAEAILECDPGRYCCDANRPDAEGDSSKGCCNTSNARFSLNNGVVFSSVGNGPSSDAVSSASSAISSVVPSSTTTASDTPTQTSITTTESPTFVDPPTSVVTNTPIISSIISTSSPDTPTSGTSTSTTTSVDQNNNTPQDSTSIILVTSIITQSNGASSALVTSSTSIIAAPASTPSSTSSASSNPGSSSKASTIAPAVAVPVAVLALAFLAFFLWRRKRRQQKATTWENDSPGYKRRSEPVDMYASQKPQFPDLHSPVSYASPDQIGGVSPSGEKVGEGMGTAPPSYRGAGGLAPGDATRVGGGGNINRGSELPGSVPASPGFSHGTMPGSPVEHTAGLMGQGGGLRIANPTPEPETETHPQPSELPGSTYHPYRPPGGGG